MNLHAGSTPANAHFSLSTPFVNKENNFSSLQELLLNLSEGPLKVLQISTGDKRALADQFVKKLSSTVNLHTSLPEASKISKKLAFEPLAISNSPHM
jgi:hypothetical protein